MPQDAPPIRDVLSGNKTPSGEGRYGLFSPELKKQRKEWAKVTFLSFGLVTVLFFIYLSIYFGSYYEQAYRSDHFSVEVLDLDSAASPQGSVAHPAILGPALRTAVTTSLQSDPHLGWYFAGEDVIRTMRLTTSGQGRDPLSYGMERVGNQDVWAVVVVNANATSGVWAGLTAGQEWTPSGAFTFIIQEARNFYGTEQYVRRIATTILTQAGDSAGGILAAQVLALGNASAVLAAAPSGTLPAPFAYSQYTLAPFDQLAGIPATTVGTIYLIIFTFLISVLWNQLALPTIKDKLTLGWEIFVKLLVPFLGYFWLSLHYSLVSLAFLVKFDRALGRGGFVVYWMANFVTMTGLGYVMEAVFLWLGPMFFPFFLLFWVIVNVSVAFLDITDMATFYRYGYMMPIWNLVEASKYLIFNTKNHLVQNFVVNLAWLVVWAGILAGTVAFQRRRTERQKMREAWGKMSEKQVKEKREARSGGRGEKAGR